MNPNNLPVFEIDTRTMDISDLGKGENDLDLTEVTYWGDPPEHEKYRFKLVLAYPFYFDGRVIKTEHPLPDSTKITIALEGIIDVDRSDKAA